MIRAQLYPSIIITLLYTVCAGLLFPILIYAAAQVLFPYQANGSLILKDGKVVGSELIGQVFTQAKYFHSRPSAAGSGYDASNSGGTNLGPTSRKLFSGVADDPSTPTVDESFAGVSDLARLYREENGLQPNDLVPVDAVTRSASGLDPHISPLNARLQAARVAKARGISLQEVLTMIEANTQGRFLKVFGEPRVNVLKLNLSLDAAASSVSQEAKL